MKTEQSFASPGKRESLQNLQIDRTCSFGVNQKNFLAGPNLSTFVPGVIYSLHKGHKGPLRVKSLQKLLRPDLLIQLGPNPDSPSEQQSSSLFSINLFFKTSSKFLLHNFSFLIKRLFRYSHAERQRQGKRQRQIFRQERGRFSKC